jgi:malate dehydrogenase (oxaloacetate-decarboxylating)
VLIALSKPGPDTVSKEDISRMSDKSIVFTCANPVPEIYPYAAKEAGAFIAATGRGDFPNQVNNSLCFPGVLKGALLVNAKKITDAMAICAAKSIAKYAEDKGLTTESIIPTMDDIGVFPQVAADVAMQAIKDGVSRIEISWKDAHDITAKEIAEARGMTDMLIKEGLIKEPPQAMLDDALTYAIEQIKK